MRKPGKSAQSRPASAKPTRSGKPARPQARPGTQSTPRPRPSTRRTEEGPTASTSKPAAKAAPRGAGQDASRPRPAARRTEERPRPSGRRPEEGSAPTGARPATPKPRVLPGGKVSTKPASTAPPRPMPRRSASQDGERLQKLLAHAGVASRRACEELILEGHVQINGVTVTELGTKADPFRDQITVDFMPIRREAPVYILMNKPKGYVTTVKDDEGRPTVMALLQGVPARVYPVGRLDFQSEGLLLLTNDGELAHRMTAPDFHIPKIYDVKVHRTVPPETLDEFRNGFRLSGRRLKPCGIEVLDKQGNPWLRVTLTEGKNQQIRRMFAAVGHPVHKLRRIQFGPLVDPALKPGDWRFLTPQELTALKAF